MILQLTDADPRSPSSNDIGIVGVDTDGSGGYPLRETCVGGVVQVLDALRSAGAIDF